MYTDPCEQWGFPGAANDWEDPLKEGTATHSSILACRIPWTEEPGQGWGTTVHRITQSQTQLKQRSSTEDPNILLLIGPF